MDVWMYFTVRIITWILFKLHFLLKISEKNVSARM